MKGGEGGVEKREMLLMEGKVMVHWTFIGPSEMRYSSPRPG